MKNHGIPDTEDEQIEKLERPPNREEPREKPTDRDFGWEEGDPADRRKDPLRKL